MCDIFHTSATRARLAAVMALLAPMAALTGTAAQTLAFDAASVKVNRSGFPGGLMDFRAGGQFSAVNETLLQLVRAAYNLDVYRIVDGPEWMRRDRFDVQARASADVSRDQARLMLQQLLADRFNLRVRRETKQTPTYVLRAVRTDGRTGAGLRPASPDACLDRGPQPGRIPAGELPSCGLLPSGPERMSGRRVGLALLTTQLSSITGRVVEDRTGLTGMFDIDLEWAMTEAQVAALAVLTPPGGTPPVANPNHPGLFTALEEQLGLKLQPSTGAVDVLIVESADRPDEN